MKVGYFRGSDWFRWVMETEAWVPAPDQVEGRPFAGMTGGVAGMTEGAGTGLVGFGDEGLGPRFRGDDEGVAGMLEGWRG